MILIKYSRHTIFKFSEITKNEFKNFFRLLV